MNVVTSINMSNYIASDVPLSPISADWETSTNLDLSTLNYSYPVGSSGSDGYHQPSFRPVY